MTGIATRKGLRGLLFDKDGTLFDFQASWGGWAADLVLELAGNDADLADAASALIRLDRAARRFYPDSVAIAGTADEAAAALHPGLPHLSQDEILFTMIERSRGLAPVEAAPLAPLLSQLKEAGFLLGVATNDSEDPARAQLAGLGVESVFELIIGADSGHGAKPDPGQCLAFADAIGVAPGEVAMIGDSTHDLLAGAAAGMVPVAVLTGTASEADLSSHAEVVLPDIGHLPAWLGVV
ncbi:phosphoglycolate phosphatase [Aliiruegeria haliotis]|uniref:phosphoglycolate phosphatase n=1 Tax=Aliiruegeria haliotis TaxID=1280846 RepID=A0A2T0RUT2_9RHOB|nr:HAD family hydrolase [Aliiruegeria haliotis]PRY24907.1 phosphoglycolate phosphatase [Aliiruegeria haliotis]